MRSSTHQGKERQRQEMARKETGNLKGVATFKTSEVWPGLGECSLKVLVSPVAQMVKNLPWRRRFDSWMIPCRSEWLPTPVFLPEEFHG